LSTFLWDLWAGDGSLYGSSVLARVRDVVRREGALHVGVLVAVVAAAVAIRLVDLGAPMRFDEAFSFRFYASESLRSGLSDYASPTNHLLSTLLMHVSWRVFGNHPWALRLPALITGIALVPAMYAAGRAVYDRQAGLIAAALAAGSVVFVQYSVNARGYGPATLFFACAIAFGAHAVRSRSRAAWAGFAASCVLAFYSAAFMALAVAVVALWAALEALAGPPARPLRDRVPLLRDLAIALAVVAAVSAALYAPTFGDAGWDYTFVWPLHSLSAEWQLAGRTWDQWQRQVPLPLWPILTAAFLAGTVLHGRVARVRVPLLAPAAVGVLGAIVKGPFAPFPKHWIWLLPIFFLGAAAGLAAVARAAAPRLRLGETALAAGLAVAAFAMLAAGYMAAGNERMRLDMERPGGADDLAHFVRRHYPHPVVLAQRATITAGYYFQRDRVAGLTSELTPQQQAAGSTLLVTWDAEGEGPLAALRSAGVAPAPGTRPELVKRWPWVSLWAVRLARP
jgi:hypothetical protein